MFGRPGHRAPIWPLCSVAMGLAVSAGAAAHAQPSSRMSPEAEPASPGESAISADEIAGPLHLALGEQLVLSAVGVTSYSEANPNVVDVRLTRDGRRFVLVGRGTGQTTLLLLMDDGKEHLIRLQVGSVTPASTSADVIEVLPRENIRLDFYFVQLERANSTRVGVRPPEALTLGRLGASFDFLSMTFQSATAVVEDQALLGLDLAQTFGIAKVLRRAVVITENGKSATFSGGGEVNIPVQGSLSTGIHRIAFGSKIEVLPRYDPARARIQLSVSADVSDLADDRGSGAPGRATSTLSTNVNVELGQAVVLAGLTAESQQDSRTGWPVLSQIPVLGILFGGRRKALQQTDTVILIMPSVQDAATVEAKRRIDAAFAAYRGYRGGGAAHRALREVWQTKAETVEEEP